MDVLRKRVTRTEGVFEPCPVCGPGSHSGSPPDRPPGVPQRRPRGQIDTYWRECVTCKPGAVRPEPIVGSMTAPAPQLANASLKRLRFLPRELQEEAAQEAREAVARGASPDSAIERIRQQNTGGRAFGLTDIPSDGHLSHVSLNSAERYQNRDPTGHEAHVHSLVEQRMAVVHPKRREALYWMVLSPDATIAEVRKTFKLTRAHAEDLRGRAGRVRAEVAGDLDQDLSVPVTEVLPTSQYDEHEQFSDVGYDATTNQTSRRVYFRLGTLPRDDQPGQAVTYTGGSAFAFDEQWTRTGGRRRAEIRRDEIHGFRVEVSASDPVEIRAYLNSPRCLGEYAWRRDTPQMADPRELPTVVEPVTESIA